MSNENKLDMATIVASSIHDMKNSLSIVLNSSEKLSKLSDQLDAEDRMSLDEMRYESRRLNNNFIQLLALYKLENGQYFANIDSHEVYDLLEEVVFENEATLALRDISITMVCDDSLTWFYDRDLLLGILNTMINNAYRYTNSKIMLSASVCKDGLFIHINDDGQGYPQHMLGQLSQAFTSIDFKTGNTGLGLHFASAVMALHNRGDRQGDVLLDNGGELGGALVTLFLPR